MSKLIYAKSKAGFETAYPTKDTIQKSIVFTEDGYLWTHGQYFRIFNDSASPLFTSSISGSVVTLKDASNKTLTSFDVGVVSITGDTIISSTTTNGAATLTHSAPFSAAQSAGPSADSSTSITVPQLVFDKYGHYTGVTNRTATLNQVKQNLNTTSTTAYLLTGTSATTTNSAETNFNTNLKVDLSTSTLYALIFSGSLQNSLTLTINGTAVVYNNSAAKSSTFYAPTSSGTTGTDYYLTPTTSGAPVWQQADSSIASGSTKLITSGAVYSAVNSIIATTDAMVYKGVLDATSSGLPAANKGDTYKVSVAGNFNNTKPVEVGDMLICNTDNTAAVAYGSITASSWNSWDVIQTNLTTSTAGLSLLNLSTPASTSLISVTSGGVASANYTLSGTGNVVALTTSPTFTTPILGAATATSINGLNITTTTGTLTIASGKTLTVNNSVTLSGTDGSTISFGSGGTVVYTSNINTSAGLASILGDETGSGKVVFNTSPTFVGDVSFTHATAGTDTFKISPNSTATSAFTGIFTWNNLTANRTWTLPDNGGIIALTTDIINKASNLAGGVLGSLPYQSNVDTTSMLAPNTTTTKKYLTQTGTGTVGAAPAWNQIVTSDISDLTTASTGITKVGTITTGTWNGSVIGVVYGGTGLSSIGKGNILYGSNTNTLSALANPTSDNWVLTFDLTTGLPKWEYPTDSWRDILLRTTSNPTSAASIGTNSLKFGEEFFWDTTNLEVKMGWAEIASDGTLTYAY